MLNLKRFLSNYEKGARSFSELLPWMILLRPDVVLNKDMSLLVCYSFEGVDSEGMQDEDIDRHAALMQHAYRHCNEHITVWFTVDRRRTQDYTQGRFDDPVSQFLDDHWKQGFMEGQQYSNRYHLSFLYTPSVGMEGFWNRVSYFSRVENQGYFIAMVRALWSSVFKKWSFAFLQGMLEVCLRDFEQILKSIEATLAELRLRRLEDGDLLEFLHDRASPASAGQPVSLPGIPAYLDGYLADNELGVEENMLCFRHHETVYAAVLSIKDWPALTWPGVYDELLAIPGEMVLSQVFRFADFQAAERYIKSVERHNRFLQVPLLGHIRAAWTQQPARTVNTGRSVLARDASDALAGLTAGGQLFGYYNLSLMAYGRSREGAEETLRLASRTMQRQGYLAVREAMHIRSAWAGTLPGQWALLVRWWFVHSANLADLSPVRTISTGSRNNAYLSEQMQSLQPALTVLSTRFATPFYFNFHVGDLAHTLVLGPSRTGKSVFNNFLIAQFTKYPGHRVIIFDKDYSCRIPSVLQGGTHIDLGESQARAVRLNPMGLLRDRYNWNWIVQWIEILVTSRGYRMSAEDDGEIWKALERVHDLPSHLWRLQALVPFLSEPLREQLEQWAGEGQFARYFDHEEDELVLGHWSCIEMGALFRSPRLACAFLDYAFFCIQLQLTGEPTLIYIEEAWFMLADPVFEAKLGDWLRTLAKKNAFVLLATQSLDEVAQSRLFSVMIDNIPNRIYLPNPNAQAHRDLYMGRFGLNARQVEQIQAATPKRHYYIVTPSLSRLVDVVFPPAMLACLRSDSLAQTRFKVHQDSGRLDWKWNYVKEMTHAGHEATHCDVGDDRV
ncbi:MAG: type IV secretion system protein VirB4 [Proteobacteria bacterium]|nr:type IV secretion system protein VirB4 [Pseudomonadota bacterium]